MKPRRFDLGLLCGVLLSFASMLVVTSCTPKDREALSPMIVPAIKAGCVFLRAIFKDGTTNDICVTAEDLAPLVSEIIAEREERGDVEPQPKGPIVAFAIKEEPRPRLSPKRRCAAWVSVESSKDAGSERGDAGRAIGREGASADAGRVDASSSGGDGGGR